MSNEFDGMVGGSSDGLDVGGGSEYAGYPLVMWMNGNVSNEKLGPDNMEYTGGFFLVTVYRNGEKLYQRIPEGADKAQYTEVDFSAMGWKRDYFISQSNSQRVTGWWRKDMQAAFICGRERWEVYQDVDGKKKVLGFTNYKDAEAKGSPRGQMQVLAIVKGMEDFGPVVLRFKGYSMKAFKGQADFASFGVLHQLQNKVTIPAGRLLPKSDGTPSNINYRAVWCHFGPHVKDGAPVFYKAGKGESSTMVVVPAYYGGAIEKKEDIGKFYVGAQLITTVNMLFDNAAEWANAWKNLKGEAQGAPADESTTKPTAAVANNQLAAVAAQAGL